MNKVAVRKAWNAFKFHARIMWRGLYRVLYGTLVAALLAISVCGFMVVSNENGWVAVAYFILSVSILVMSCVYIYGIGKGGKNY